MQITSLVLAPFVSLVLILMPTVILVHRDKPHGLPLQIAYQDKECFDNRRDVVAQVLANGNVSLNSEVPEIRRSQLADRLNQIFRTRAERLIFIEADPDLPLSSVVEIIDISQSQVDFVAILTPAAEGACRSMHLTSPAIL
jgi:biopolymer transport protein TolR